MLPVIWSFWLPNWYANRGSLLQSYWWSEKKQTPVLGKKDQSTETSSALKVEQGAAFQKNWVNFKIIMLSPDHGLILWLAFLMTMIEICHLNDSALFIIPSYVFSYAVAMVFLLSPFTANCTQQVVMWDSGIWYPDIETIAKGLTICLNLKLECSNQERLFFSYMWYYSYKNIYVLLVAYLPNHAYWKK